MFKVTVTGVGQIYKAPNQNPTNSYVALQVKVLEERADNNGTTWYRIGRNKWINSTVTNKPKGTTNTSEDKSKKEEAKSSQQTAKTSAPTTNTKVKSSTNVKKESSIQAKATPEFASKIAQSFVEQLNTVRQSMGKRALNLDPSMKSFAETRANEQLILYGHQRPNGQDFNYGECIARENLALNTSVSEAAKEALDHFLYNDAGSDWGHRKNLLSDPYDTIGVGVTFEKKPGLSWGNYQYKDSIGFVLVVDLH